MKKKSPYLVVLFNFVFFNFVFIFIFIFISIFQTKEGVAGLSKDVILETPRTTLRFITREDETEILAILTHPDTQRSDLILGEHDPKKVAQSLLQTDTIPLPASPESVQGWKNLRFVVLSTSERKVIGFAGLSKVSESTDTFGLPWFQFLMQPKWADIGYFISPQYSGRGIMTEVAQSLSDFALQKLGITRIFAKTPTGHLASQRVLKKANFRYLGSGYSLFGFGAAKMVFYSKDLLTHLPSPEEKWVAITSELQKKPAPLASLIGNLRNITLGFLNRYKMDPALHGCLQVVFQEWESTYLSHWADHSLYSRDQYLLRTLLEQISPNYLIKIESYIQQQRNLGQWPNSALTAGVSETDLALDTFESNLSYCEQVSYRSWTTQSLQGFDVNKYTQGLVTLRKLVLKSTK